MSWVGVVNAVAMPSSQGRRLGLRTIRCSTPVKMFGGAYDYVRVVEDATATKPAVDDPLDLLPRTRAQGFVQLLPERRFAALARVRFVGQSLARVGGVCAMPPCTLPAYTVVEATATA